MVMERIERVLGSFSLLGGIVSFWVIEVEVVMGIIGKIWKIGLSFVWILWVIVKEDYDDDSKGDIYLYSFL